jgi:hypothetical protein
VDRAQGGRGREQQSGDESCVSAAGRPYRSSSWLPLTLSSARSFGASPLPALLLLCRPAATPFSFFCLLALGEETHTRRPTRPEIAPQRRTYSTGGVGVGSRCRRRRFQAEVALVQEHGSWRSFSGGGHRSRFDAAREPPGGTGFWRRGRGTGSRTHGGGYFPERGGGLCVWPGLLLLVLSNRCVFGWIEEEGRGWKEEAGRGERIRQRRARVPPNFIPRKCDWSRRISDGWPHIVGPLGRTGLVSFLLYLIFFLFLFFLLHHCEVAHTNNYLIYTNSFSICNRLYISCLVEISKNLKLFFTIFYTLNEFLYGYRN